MWDRCVKVVRGPGAHPAARIAPALLVALALTPTGCAAGTDTGTGPGADSSTATGALATGPAARAAPASGKPRPARRRDEHRRRAHARRGRAPALAYSTAGNEVVQRQPPAGSCHALGSGLYSRPDPSCTPGALNPAVTQTTLSRTICAAGWTESVRPPERVTESEKTASLAAYGDSGPLGAYEYDHFVPLELGGATNDPRNLWPEPGASPNPKDAVEDDLRREVCDGQLTLAQAQRTIVANWTKLAGHPTATSGPPATSSTPTPARGTPAGAERCTATAAYSSRYGDYDVYVHSNVPDQTVTVSDSLGHSDSWHTDGSGYADVYFKSGGEAPGRRITARVGTAACSTTL
jgi:hypothetical protein